MSWITFLLLVGVVVHTPQTELMPLELRGKAIYERGSGGPPPIKAVLNEETPAVEAALVPCASCHGRDGRGRAEGGLTPSDLTPNALRRPYMVKSGTRTHGPYDDRSMTRAIALGVDSSGNRLDPAMPRYQMSRPDMQALLAYLNRLDSMREPGLSDSAVRIGVILPPDPPLGAVAADVRSALIAYTKETTIHGRKLELVFGSASGNATERATAVRAFLARERPFALVSSFTEGADLEIAAAVEASGVPMLATLSATPASSKAPTPWVRDLFAGLADQVRALLHLAAKNLGTGHRIAIVGGNGELGSVAAREAKSLGFPLTTFPPESPGIGQQAQADPDILLILGSLPPIEHFHGTILVPASVAHPAFFDRHEGSLYLSLPMLPSDVHSPSVSAALASASLLVDALRRTGRDLTRDGLMEAIDATSKLETGYGPPLTFRPDRHVGSTGAWIVVFGPNGVSAPVWVE
jgi:cytochrome c553